MRTPLQLQFDSTRDFSDKAFEAICYAPFTSLYFDTRGRVRVCCHNVEYCVGDVARESIADIWKGERIKALREAVARYDMTRGCQFCYWRLNAGTLGSLAMRGYDALPVSEASPTWPQMMQFSISNSCNLQCVMCDGSASSAIRAHREGRPPLAKAYHANFFEELRSFLPHLRRARFLGGEPFLQRECFRIWDMMIEDGLRIPCHVVTNGTQWNSRVERVLRELPVEITVSMDGLSSEVVEHIRVGASHPTLMTNFRRFHGYAAANRRYLTLSFCLMRHNWHEFGRLCMFGDEWGCRVYANVVRTPAHCSLYTLPDRELRRIVRAMEVEAAALLPRLTQNLEVWVGELERLRTFLRRRRARSSGGRVPGSSSTTTTRESVSQG